MMKYCFTFIAVASITFAAFAQQPVVQQEFDYVDSFSEGRAIVVRSGKCGFIDERGNVVVPLRYAYARPFSGGLAAVVTGHWRSETEIDGLYGFVDLDGKEVIPCEYEDVDSFSGGIAAVFKNRKWGGIDRQGNMVIKPQFDDSFCFTSDIAVVGIRTDKLRFGYIDKQGRVIVPCRYDAALDFDGDHAWVEKDGEMFRIDKTGTPIPGVKLHNFSWGGKYGFLSGALEDEAGKLHYGLLNKAGKLLMPFEFDFISVYGLGDEDYVVADKGAEKQRYLVKGPSEIVRVK